MDRCIECSAKSLINVSEMFYNAQKAVLHPINPIYSIEEQEVSNYQFRNVSGLSNLNAKKLRIHNLFLLQLTEKCKRALTRIFKICDSDGDGLLDDYEVTMFQKKCFDSPLQLQVIYWTLCKCSLSIHFCCVHYIARCYRLVTVAES